MSHIGIIPSHETLEAELTRLRALVIQPVSLRDSLGLQPIQERIIRHLMACYPESSLKADVYHAVTGRWHSESNALDVQISRMRAKLAAYGLRINTVRGDGWVLPDATAEQLRRMVGVVL